MSADGWYVEELDSYRSFTYRGISSMTIDSEGRIHVAYCGMAYDSEGDRRSAIMHASGRGSDWATELVAWTSMDLNEVEIRITEADAVHILWRYHADGFGYTPDQQVFVHAANMGGEWETASARIDDGGANSGRIAIGEDGTAHGLCIVREYVDDWIDGVKVEGWAYELQEWTCDSDAWNLTCVHPNPDSGRWTIVYGLAAGAEGDLRALLGLTRNGTDSPVTALAMVAAQGIDWRLVNIGGYPIDAHSRIDPEGRMHVAFIKDGNPREVRYLVNEGISEEDYIQLVGYQGESSLGGYRRVSIFLDVENEPHVAYVMDYHSIGLVDMKLARKIDGQWESQDVRSRNMPIPQGGISLAIDEAGVAHIAFYGRTSSTSYPFSYATSDEGEVLKLALWESAAFTGVGALVVGLPAFVLYRSYRKRVEGRELRESLGLYDPPGWFTRKRS